MKKIKYRVDKAIVSVVVLLLILAHAHVGAELKPKQTENGQKTGKVLASDAIKWSKDEIDRLEMFSFAKIPSISSDPSNRYLLNPGAIKLGKKLFHDKKLSGNGKIACASCHQKEKLFTDGLTVSQGLAKGRRNTPSLLGVADQTWFFWDGRADSLWSQALDSLENPAEHGLSRSELVNILASDDNYRNRYRAVFGEPLADDLSLTVLPQSTNTFGTSNDKQAGQNLYQEKQQRVNRIAANVAKSIAAYVATLRHKPGRFDRFVKQLGRQGHSAVLNASEQNGLRLFMSHKTGCTNCHFGALFTNHSFHSIGTGSGSSVMGDNGRADSIDKVVNSEFNCLGQYSDAPREQCQELEFALTDKQALAGLFKTPGLRNISKTAPYMHDGRFATLAEVVAYYASFSEPNATLHADLPVISLSAKEQHDLVNFLQSL